jgi:poly-gamma-glutamate capsule biosynthesis protein CapA/YwtB (metallophosphatase superfamily)
MSPPGAIDPSPGRFTVAAVGDVMLAREVGRHLQESPDDFAMPDIRASLAGTDLILANLENPVAKGGRPDPVQDPHVTFRAAPNSLDVLKGIGVTVVALGNNHMLDYGEAALVETLEHLDAAGIKRVGAGRNYEEANAPLLLEYPGRHVAVLSHAFIYSANTRMATRSSPGIADHRMPRILPRIRDLAASGHDVIVTIHWGYEYRFFPLPYQMRHARRMIDAGARMVLGHGPHYPQGIEVYRGREIVYSLGNFIFDEPYKFAKRSFIYRAEIDDSGNTHSRGIVPVHLPNHVPHVVHGTAKRQLEGLVANLGTRYQRTASSFWRDHSAAYLTEIGGRVLRGRSLKYPRVLPPAFFYRDVGITAILRMLKPANLVRALRGLRSR